MADTSLLEHNALGDTIESEEYGSDNNNNNNNNSYIWEDDEDTMGSEPESAEVNDDSVAIESSVKEPICSCDDEVLDLMSRVDVITDTLYNMQQVGRGKIVLQMYLRLLAEYKKQAILDDEKQIDFFFTAMTIAQQRLLVPRKIDIARTLSAYEQEYKYLLSKFSGRVVYAGCFSNEIDQNLYAEVIMNAIYISLMYILGSEVKRVNANMRVCEEAFKENLFVLDYVINLKEIQENLPWVRIEKSGKDLNSITAIASLHVFLSYLLETGGEKQENLVKTTMDDELAKNPLKRATVDSLVKSIMMVYEVMYKPCFSLAPKGVLSPEGIIYYDEDNETLKVDQYTSTGAYNLYNFMLSYFGDALKCSKMSVFSADLINADFSLKENYCPLSHAYRVFGLYMTENGNLKRETNWVLYQKHLYEEVKRTISKIVLNQNLTRENASKFENALKTLFTNVIIIDEYDVNTVLRMRTKVETVKTKMQGLGNEIEKNVTSLFSKSNGVAKLISNKVGRVGESSFLLIFDSAEYARRIEFSYKTLGRVLKSGSSIGLTNTVLGIDLAGNILTKNFMENSLLVSAIIAGSRSGKGVMTLNILATIVASENPFMYLDFKPDMSGALWEMDRDYNVPIFAIDGASNRTVNGFESPRDYPVKMGKLVSPTGQKLLPSDMRVLLYLKSLQLFLTYCGLVTASVTFDSCKNKRLFLIMDEAQSANKASIQLYEFLKNLLPTPKAKVDTITDMQKYAARLNQVFLTDLKTHVDYYISKTGAMSSTMLLMLGQQINPERWGGRSWLSYPISSLFASSTYKLCGRNCTSGHTGYDPFKDNFDGKEFVVGDNTEGGSGGKMGYWGEISGNGGRPRVFKACMTLNKNDFIPGTSVSDMTALNSPDMLYTGKLLANIADESVREEIVNDDFMVDGKINKAVGFAGLIEMISGYSDSNAIEKMRTGYDLMWEVMCKTGLSEKYSTIEEYLSDCTMDGLFTVTELEEAGVSGRSVFELMQNGETENEVDNDGFVTTGDSFDGIADGSASIGANKAQKAKKGNAVFGAYSPDFTTVTDELDCTNDSACTEELNIPDESAVNDEMPEFTTFEGKGIDNAGIKMNDETFNFDVNAESAYESPSDVGMFSPDTSVADAIAGGTDTSLKRMISLESVSNQLVSMIVREFMSLTRITNFVVTASGGLVINGINFRPRPSKQLLNSLPVDLKACVARGDWAELFNFRLLYKMTNLQVLEIENIETAEYRATVELGIRQFSWRKLFKKFKFLRKITIGTVVFEKNGTGGDGAEYPEFAGVALKEKLAKAFSLPTFSVSSMANVYKNKRVPRTLKLVGTIAGAGAMFWLASTLGIMALPFGLFLGSRLKK